MEFVRPRMKIAQKYRVFNWIHTAFAVIESGLN